MNWLIPNYYVNIEYKNVKCKYCGTIIILNQNIRSKTGKIKPINLDNSLHYCDKLDQKGSSLL